MGSSFSRLVVIFGVFLATVSAAAAQATPSASPVAGGAWNTDAAKGSGFSALTPAPVGTVAVVATGFTDNNGFLPVIVHNNTDVAIDDVRVEGVVLNDDHELIAVAGAALMKPGWIEPQAVAIGSMHLEDRMILDEGTLQMLVTYDSPAERDRFGSLEPVITEWNQVDNRVPGILSNPHDQEITDPEMRLVCLSSGGTIMFSKITSTNDDVIPPGGMIPFQVTIDVPECDHMLIVTDGRT